MASITLTRDDLTPTLADALKLAKNPTPIMRAMGTTFLSITLGNFNSAGAAYRPTAWAPKKDGKPSILQKSGAMAKAFHLTVTPTLATVQNAMPYAAGHQFGVQTKPHVIRPRRKQALAFGGGVFAKVNHPGSKIPPRPFFPVLNGKLTAPAAQKISAAGLRVLGKQLGAT